MKLLKITNMCFPSSVFIEFLQLVFPRNGYKIEDKNTSIEQKEKYEKKRKINAR